MQNSSANKPLTYLKAARVQRSAFAVMVMLIPAAFMGVITFDLIAMIGCVIITYAAFGLHNAIQDFDYDLPKNAPAVSIFLLVVGGAISLYNPIITFAFVAWIVLGYFYNTAARKILFADALTVTFTHTIIPLVASSYLLGMDPHITKLLAFSFFMIFIFFVNTKNIKDKEQDSKLGYATIVTKFKHGEIISYILVEVSFIFMLLPYFLLDLGMVYLGLIFFIHIIKSFYLWKFTTTTQRVTLLRLLMIIFLMSIVIDVATIFVLQLIVGFLIGLTARNILKIEGRIQA